MDDLGPAARVDSLYPRRHRKQLHVPTRNASMREFYHFTAVPRLLPTVSPRHCLPSYLNPLVSRRATRVRIEHAYLLNEIAHTSVDLL